MLIIGNYSLSYCKIISIQILLVYWHIGAVIRNYVLGGYQVCRQVMVLSMVEFHLSYSVVNLLYS